MRSPILTALVLSSALLLGCSTASAQSATVAKPAVDPSEMMSELCGCMSAIDTHGSDRSVEVAVRGCLENAMVAHPVEVRAILQHRSQGGSKAYQLGTALGGALQQMCAPFRAVRERLQRMPQPIKQGT
jgi:hypothetical protein